jgi:hypothetical protein
VKTVNELNAVSTLLTPILERHEFHVLSLAADRHGSWEWSFHKHAGGLNRFVVVALTDVPLAVSDPPAYAVEVKAGADDDRSYVKHTVAQLTVRSVELLTQIPHEFGEEVERAIGVAEGIDENQLQERYLPTGGHSFV